MVNKIYIYAFFIIIYISVFSIENVKAQYCDSTIENALKNNIVKNIEAFSAIKMFDREKSKYNFYGINAKYFYGINKGYRNIGRFVYESYFVNNCGLYIDLVPNEFYYPDTSYMIATFEVPFVRYQSCCSDDREHFVSIGHTQPYFSTRYLVAYRADKNLATGSVSVLNIIYISGSFVKNKICWDFDLKKEDEILNFIKLKTYNLAISHYGTIEKKGRNVKMKVMLPYFGNEEITLSFSLKNPDVISLYDKKNNLLWRNDMIHEASFYGRR